VKSPEKLWLRLEIKDTGIRLEILREPIPQEAFAET
jgi:hypothetical protein